MADRPEHAIDEEATPLREYIAVLRLRKWSVLGIAFLVLASTLFFSFQQTPIYESEAKVLVKPVTSASVPGAVPQPPNLETERELVASAAVAEIVGEGLDVAEDPEALLDDLEVEVATNTEILLIRYGHPDPLEAQGRTQAFADSYLEFRRAEALEELLAASDAVQKQISSVNRELVEVMEEISATNVPSERAQLEARQATLTSRIAVLEQKLTELTPVESLRVGQVVQPADLPSSPASPNYLLNAALALFVGLALGVGLAFLRERLDDRLR
ncbi:MAG: YveK family protein, partial [Actinomycetota bacterium]